jgi:hypothetical protein
MYAGRPIRSAISRLLCDYKAALAAMSIDELKGLYFSIWQGPADETQLLGFTIAPSRDWLIQELVGKREIELERMTPLQIDDLLDQEPN